MTTLQLLAALLFAIVSGTQSTATVVSDRRAATGAVVADTFWSQSLGIRKRVMVWLPPSYSSQPLRRYPVAVYLHGGWGTETDWVALGRLDATLDSLVSSGVPEMIVVMPDGDDGFYTTWNFLGDYTGCRQRTPPGRRVPEPVDTYCVPWPHYDDYIARDLVAFIDGRYRTVPDRNHRGIAGLSMGGYGAIALTLSYPDVFSAAASHSGVLAPARATSTHQVPSGRFDLDSLRVAYDLNLWSLVGPPFGTDSIAWAARDPSQLAARLKARWPDLIPALFVDCGLEDGLLLQSRFFRDAVGALGIPLEYGEYSGGHNWDYWRRHAAASAAWLANRLSVP